jgi:alcohol dehydrogenase class IV
MPRVDNRGALQDQRLYCNDPRTGPGTGNWKRRAEKFAVALGRVARALGAAEAAGALFDLAAKNGAPTSLRQIGMSESDLDKAADAALQAAYWNPRPIERNPIRALLEDAYHGRRPSEQEHK